MAEDVRPGTRQTLQVAMATSCKRPADALPQTRQPLCGQLHWATDLSQAKVDPSGRDVIRLPDFLKISMWGVGNNGT